VWYQCACVRASVGVVCPERVALCAAVLIIYMAMDVGM
jgi:hypothetical protein